MIRYEVINPPEDLKNHPGFGNLPFNPCIVDGVIHVIFSRHVPLPFFNSTDKGAHQ